MSGGKTVVAVEGPLQAAAETSTVDRRDHRDALFTEEVEGGVTVHADLWGAIVCFKAPTALTERVT